MHTRRANQVLADLPRAVASLVLSLDSGWSTIESWARYVLGSSSSKIPETLPNGAIPSDRTWASEDMQQIRLTFRQQASALCTKETGVSWSELLPTLTRTGNLLSRTMQKHTGHKRLASRMSAQGLPDEGGSRIGPAGHALNPDWCEWLMGFPEGWTDVEFKPLVTPLSRKSVKCSEKSCARCLVLEQRLRAAGIEP
jgi:hypothetical protein